MSAQPIDFSSIGGKPVQQAPIDFSSIGGKRVEENQPAQKQPEEKPSAAYRFVKSATDTMPGAGAEPKDLVSGPMQMVEHPLESLKLVWDAANSVQSATQQRALAKLKEPGMRNKVEGAIRGFYGMIPFVGPMLEKAGDQFQQGDVAGGLGTTAGLGTQLALASPEARGNVAAALPDVSGALASKAPTLYKSALKPSTTLPPAQVTRAINTALEEKIPVSAQGLRDLGDLKDALEQKISDTIGSGQGKTVNKFAVTSRLSKTAKTLSNQVNPEADLNAVSESGNEFLRNQPNEIPAADAQALKVGTYQQLRGKYGQLGSGTIEAQKALARGIKEELANQFPELAGTNAKYGSLTELETVLERAVQRISNHQLMGIGTPITAGAAKAVTGSSPVAAVAGLLKAVVDDPFVKSKLAMVLWRAGRKIPMQAATARIDAYSAALGAGVASASAENQNQPTGR